MTDSANGIRIGQVYQENDSREERFVEIVAINRREQKVRLLNRKKNRCTWASMDRFSGTKASRGYTLVKEAA